MTMTLVPSIIGFITVCPVYISVSSKPQPTIIRKIGPQISFAKKSIQWVFYHIYRVKLSLFHRKKIFI